MHPLGVEDEALRDPRLRVTVEGDDEALLEPVLRCSRSSNGRGGEEELRLIPTTTTTMSLVAATTAAMPMRGWRNRAWLRMAAGGRTSPCQKRRPQEEWVCCHSRSTTTMKTPTQRGTGAVGRAEMTVAKSRAARPGASHGRTSTAYLLSRCVAVGRVALAWHLLSTCVPRPSSRGRYSTRTGCTTQSPSTTAPGMGAAASASSGRRCCRCASRVSLSLLCPAVIAFLCLPPLC